MKLLNRKFPTLLGLIFIVVGIIATTILTGTGTNLISRAGPGIEPKDVRVTNLSDSSFTVSYLTDDQVIGTVDVGSDLNNLSEQFLDDRDQVSQTVNKYYVHSLTIRNLSPNTSYVFSINSGGKEFNNESFTARTGSVLDQEPFDAPPVSGTVLLPDGSNSKEAIVYQNIGDAQKFSTLTKDGRYLIPLNSLRTEDLQNYFKVKDDDNINLEVFSEKYTSTINVTLKQANPVPPITLSNSYNFSEEQEATQAAQQDSSFPKIDGEKQSNDPTITSPKTTEGLSDQQPEFMGTALPNETVEITINSEEVITASVKADSGGNWSYRPDSELAPGQHTITIKTKNGLGIIKTITRSFTVYAAGTTVEQTATPSGTLTPTSFSPTPISTPTPSVAVELSPVPTLPPTGPSSIIKAGIGGLIKSILSLFIH